MKTTVSLHDFRMAFRTAGRGEQFSYEGLKEIFDYIESYEKDCGCEVELDVIEICCEWAEDSYLNIAQQYDIEIEGLDDDDAAAEVVDYLNGVAQYAATVNSTDIVYIQF